MSLLSFHLFIEAEEISRGFTPFRLFSPVAVAVGTVFFRPLSKTNIDFGKRLGSVPWRLDYEHNDTKLNDNQDQYNNDQCYNTVLTLSIMTLGITNFRKITFSIMTFSII
jgi:hypothetical protein